MYNFSREALQKFAEQHDIYMKRKADICDDDQRRGVLAKSIGQLARLCGVLHVLDQAFQWQEANADIEIEKWDFVIADTTVERAVLIMDYLIEQKFALMAPERVYNNAAQGEIVLDGKEEFIAIQSQKLKKTLEYVGNQQEGKLTPTDIVQRRLFVLPKVNGKGDNKACNAIPYLEEVSKLGFGDIVEETSTSGRKTKVFMKRPLEDLDDDSRDLLKRLKVDEEKYKLLFGKKKDQVRNECQ